MILKVATLRCQARLSTSTSCGRSIDAAPAHLPGRSYLVIGSYLEAAVFVAVLEALAFASVFEASVFCRTGRLAVLVKL